MNSSRRPCENPRKTGVSGDGGFDGCEIQAENGSGMRDRLIMRGWLCVRSAYALSHLAVTSGLSVEPPATRHPSSPTPPIMRLTVRSETGPRLLGDVRPVID